MHKKRRFRHLICKNAAEAKKKFTLFADYRKNTLSLQFVNVAILLKLTC